MRERTAGLLVDWRMAFAALIRALSLSILRCTLATVSSTLDMATAGEGARRRRRGRCSPPTAAGGDGVSGGGRLRRRVVGAHAGRLDVRSRAGALLVHARKNTRVLGV